MLAPGSMEQVADLEEEVHRVLRPVRVLLEGVHPLKQVRAQHRPAVE
jgi:hypothetical protein